MTQKRSQQLKRGAFLMCLPITSDATTCSSLFFRKSEVHVALDLSVVLVSCPYLVKDAGA
jgi:hypothetical protein